MEIFTVYKTSCIIIYHHSTYSLLTIDESLYKQPNLP